MAKYLFHGSYTTDGVRGVQREGGSGRADAIGKLISGLGGTVESIYWALGKDDFFITVDLPDAVTAAAVSLAVAGSGAASVRTVALLTAQEVDQATHKSVSYRPPGVAVPPREQL